MATFTFTFIISYILNADGNTKVGIRRHEFTPEVKRSQDSRDASVCISIRLHVFNAQRYASAGISCGPVSVSVCLYVTSRCFMETDGRIDLVSGMEASFHLSSILHCLLRKFGYL